jgi:hypothetical protein
MTNREGDTEASPIIPESSLIRGKSVVIEEGTSENFARDPSSCPYPDLVFHFYDAPKQP